jgi:glycosyltransferase involved in cell wall biosynthesis
LSKILFTAAHGGFPGSAAPLGGGAAVCNWLVREWQGRRDLELELIAPAILGGGAPSDADITSYDERAYAKFCLEFSRAATRRVLAEDPARCSVLVNDISEAPDFAELAAAGFRIVTIYHVDVVDYIAGIYCRGLLSARALARAWERLRPVVSPVAPAILRLIFERQRDSLRFSHRVVVPSAHMKRILLGAYPATPEERIAVVPWGVRREEADPLDVQREAESIRREFGLRPDRGTVLCLSRISPEKGQDTLLEGLIELERQGSTRPSGLDLLVCGGPAYMRGPAHMEKLRRLAAQLKSVRVVFPGHVVGARKRAMFGLAQVYAFPSRHESYGLTLAEALSEGLPAVAFDQAGAAGIIAGAQDATGGPGMDGVLVKPGRGGAVRFAAEVCNLLDSPERRRILSERAANWASAHPFSAAADRILALLTEAGNHSGERG